MKLYKGDCLVESEEIKSGSVDLILTDLPYGTVKGAQLDGWGGTKTDWDEVIDTDEVYKIANRILRKNGKMVLFCQEPFTTELINKAVPNTPFAYRMIWEKDHFANALIAKKAPVNYYEDILIFSKTHDTESIHELRPYFKTILDYIGLNLKHINTKLGHRRAEHTFYIDSTQYGLCTEKTYLELIEVFGINNMAGFKDFEELIKVDNEFKIKFASTFNLWEGKKYKSNILKYKKDYDGHHPTQKPVLLLEDLIKTFSNEGDSVVDLTMGSGSTGVACENTFRNFIGIEQDDKYFAIAQERIQEAQQLNELL
ncbi:adenine-specific DNA methyltransferase [Polaribacter phage Danklef_4]|nr:adenine-specific DNA methyltransferase [Polaribacter phage Danklef_2]QQV90640.1 adenine-specific DNA methyltransferase [Polaribacter phage Danklef_3]QQV90717.1 adenine-specific DNA methyltransferase [Polaribacter phage Danklef_4]QQV90794.1 adenine-specific DNA methyltransferase [Polaribacter phage Danklef_5]